jgi:hypothetical protein
LKSGEKIDFSKRSKMDHTTGIHGYCFMEQRPVRSEIMGMALFEHKITATAAPRWLGIGNIAFAPRDSPALETEEWEQLRHRP